MSKDVKSKADMRKRGIKELIGGAVIAAVGGLASMASYNMAKNGETYTVYTGIIALGAVYAIYGIIHIVFPAGFGKAKKDAEPVEAETSSADEVKEED